MRRSILLIPRLAGALLALAGAAAPLGAETPSLFLPYELYAHEGWSEAVAVGDVNSDGRDDVVLTTSDLGTSSTDNRLFVYLQGPDGRLRAPVLYPSLAGDSVAIGDLDSDGRNDVVVDGVGVFFQTPSGVLSPLQRHEVNFGSLRVATADFNGDGRTDVVSIPWGSNSNDVDLFLQSPQGGLLPTQVYELRHHGYDDLEAGDVTGDGLADIVVVSGQGTTLDNIGVLAQRAGGGFSLPVYYDTGYMETFQGLAIGDFNHDGLPDVAVSSSGIYGGGDGPNYPHLAVLHGLPGGGFAPADFVKVLSAYGLAAGDFDLDGRDDVAMLLSGGSVAVSLQGKDGKLQPPAAFVLPFANNNNPHGLAIGDVDSDGLPDLVVANDNQGLIVLRNAGQLAPRPCVEDGEALCLLGDRFEVRTSWTDQHNGGRQGMAHATPRTDQSGTFWFFSPESLELTVKVLDGRGVNDKYWFFYGALSDVGYRMSVLDTVTGKLKAYVNPPGQICGRADVDAFAGTPPAASPAVSTVRLAAPASGNCTPGPEALCLLDGRLRVETRWRAQGNEDAGTAVADTDGSGFFWFFSPENLELTVKAIDGRSVNGHFWFFYGALSDVEYWITVTDTVTSRSHTYHNPQGNICGGADVGTL